jgi:hypothetical protein
MLAFGLIALPHVLGMLDSERLIPRRVASEAPVTGDIADDTYGNGSHPIVGKGQKGTVVASCNCEG